MTTPTAPTTDAAPAAAPQPAVPAATPPSPLAHRPTPGQTARQDARRRMLESRSQTPNTPAPPAASAPTAPTAPATPAPSTAPEQGTTDQQGLTPAPEATSDVAPDAEASGDQAPATEPQAQKPTPKIRVPVDSAHPLLGGRKLEAVTVESEQEANFVRSLMTASGASKQQVRQLQDKLYEAQTKITRFEAESAAREAWQKSPESKAARERYQKLVELEQANELPPGTAAEFWDSVVRNGFQKLTDQEFKTRMEQTDAQQVAARVAEWKQETRERMTQVFPAILHQMPEFSQWFDDAVVDFNAKIERGAYRNAPSVDVDREFQEFFKSQLLLQPRVRQMLNAKRAEDEAAKKAAAEKAAKEQRERETKAAVDERLRGIAEKHQAAPPHPMANLQAAARNRVPAEPQAGAQPPADATPRDIRRSARQNALERANRLTR